MTGARALLVALLLVPFLPAASAQTDGEEGVTVWTEPRTVEGEIEVANGTKLVLRGAVLTLNGTLHVRERGVLVLESVPGSPAGIVAQGPDGWNGTIRGAAYVNGTPAEPVVLDGLSGMGQLSGDTVLFLETLTVVGRLEGRHLVLRNYTSGIRVNGPGAHASLTDATFESTFGLGYGATLGAAHGERLTFRGPGATLLSAGAGEVFLRNSTMEGGRQAVLGNGNTTVLQNVTIRDAAGCVRTTAGNFTADGLACINFVEAGIVVSKPSRGFRMPNATLRNVRAETNSTENFTALIQVLRAPGTVVDGAVLGPSGQNGVFVDRDVPVLSNLEFRGVRDYAVSMLDAQSDVPRRQIGEGDAGERGWLLVGYRFAARILTPDNQPADGAVLMARKDDGSLAYRRSAPGGSTPAGLLPLFEIDASGALKETKYDLEARSKDNKARWERQDYAPDGEVLLITLLPYSEEKNPLPAPAPALWLVALVALAVALRRFRRSA